MTPMIRVSFHFQHTGACLSADRPAETHGDPFIEGSETGDFTRAFQPENPKILVFFHVGEGVFTTLRHGLSRKRSWGLRQASAPAAWASPGCDDVPVQKIKNCCNGNTVAAQEGDGKFLKPGFTNSIKFCRRCRTFFVNVDNAGKFYINLFSTECIHQRKEPVLRLPIQCFTRSSRWASNRLHPAPDWSRGQPVRRFSGRSAS
jgi:hypothetical protein